jgi:hypothetical protein
MMSDLHSCGAGNTAERRLVVALYRLTYCYPRRNQDMAVLE